MSHNDALDYAERLYARVPANYRAYDAEQGQPLRALLTVVGEQVANVREDLDALWDNFFIETCAPWVVPYIGALVGTNLVAHSIDNGDRLDVWNTILWRRNKGTPAMLRELAQDVTGWPTELAEFFQNLGWSQNLNHLRLGHPLTPDLHDLLALSLLGRARDPFAHAADFIPGRALDQPRQLADSVGLGRFSWGTPGRYQIKNVGFFVRRLKTFALAGVTPAAATPGAAVPAEAACFTFDPLFRETPLFIKETADPLTRVNLGKSPWRFFGKDLGIRQFGVPLVSDVEPTSPSAEPSLAPFTFASTTPNASLANPGGLRLMDPASFRLGASHFVISAIWQSGGASQTLGALSTLRAALGANDAFLPGIASVGTGRLTLTIQTGRAGLGWAGLPTSPSARFPGAVVAVRAIRVGPLHEKDARYIYLPPAFLTPTDTLTYFVADDGSTYTSPNPSPSSLARAAEGQVYPPRELTTSGQPATALAMLNRQPGAMRLADTTRFGGAAITFQVEVVDPQGLAATLGAISTTDQAAADPDLAVPNPWPAYTYGPSKAAIAGSTPDSGVLRILVKPVGGDFSPATELIVVNRFGQSRLVYLPELTGLSINGVRFYVADDGSTYNAASLDPTTLKRASAGQVLPIAGNWPLEQRRPLAIDLCRCERGALLRPGELGVDPELGRFAFAKGDPAISAPIVGDPVGEPRGLTVDYVEAFADNVGARTFDHQLDPRSRSTRLVARSGDASSLSNQSIAADHIHRSVADALAVADDGDVIEIVDSATYAASVEINFNRMSVRSLTVRAAAGQRPCLTFYGVTGARTLAGFHIVSPMDRLELSGLLVSGGPIQIDGPINSFGVLACTLDPASPSSNVSLIASDASLRDRASYLVCRSIVGGLRTAVGINQLTIADSIVDRKGDVAIGGTTAGAGAQAVHLERVTVIGRIHCDVLQGSESVLDDLAVVEDRQGGCLRFSRYEIGIKPRPILALPRRYQCVPTEAEVHAARPDLRCLAPTFNSRQFGRPDYLQLASTCPPEILTASERGSEIGAFAGALNTIRLENLNAKLREFLPVGLSALVIAET